VGNPFWVERYLDHEIGGVAGTYNLNDYAQQKTYVDYAIENSVRQAIGMREDSDAAAIEGVSVDQGRRSHRRTHRSPIQAGQSRAYSPPLHTHRRRRARLG
jgi:hypothetical protein